jgi:hypothetical protein
MSLITAHLPSLANPLKNHPTSNMAYTVSQENMSNESRSAPLNSEHGILYRVTWSIAATVVSGQVPDLHRGDLGQGDSEAVTIKGVIG